MSEQPEETPAGLPNPYADETDIDDEVDVPDPEDFDDD